MSLSSWTERSITSSITPPIRRITTDILSDSIEQIPLNRNLSYSIDSLKKLRKSSYHSAKQSIEKLNYEISSTISTSSYEDSLESLVIQNDDEISLSKQLNNPIECEICLEEISNDRLTCCSSSICSNCLYLHLSTNINEGRIRILCPSCSYIFTRDEILFLLSNDEILSERYKRFYANINDELHIKTCPKCCSIKEINKNLVEGIGAIH